MTTATAPIATEKTKTINNSLLALDFDATLAPVFDQNGKAIEGFRRIYRPDIDKTLSIVSEKYSLVQHKEPMRMAVEKLGKEGWTVKASRVESYGARAYVELHRRDAAVKCVGEMVGQRVMLRNTYDTSASLSFSFGALVLKCTNGLVVPGAGVSFSGQHIGDLHANFKDWAKNLDAMECALGKRMMDYYTQLDSKVSESIGKEIIKRSLGERRVDQVAQYWKTGIGRDGEMSAWNLYNGITQFLTHDFAGDWGRRERKNSQALELISGYVQTGALPKVQEEN